jgi:LytS/YehU family sensor histidine kinase
VTLPEIAVPLGGMLSGGVSGFITAIALFRLKLARMKDRQVAFETTIEGRFLAAKQQADRNHKLQVATLEIVSNLAKHLNLDRREYSDVLVRALTHPENVPHE